METFGNDTITLIALPREYFIAQVEFAGKLSRILRKSIEESVLEYTDLYSSLANEKYTDDTFGKNVSSVWRDFLQQIKSVTDAKKISDIAYALYLRQPYSRITLIKGFPYDDGRDFGVRFGALSIDYNEWNKKRHQIRLHFRPLRFGLFETDPELHKSDLSSIYLPQRQQEFSEMLEYIKRHPDTYVDAEYLLSSTWLQNIPTYQQLFPPKYREDGQFRKKIEDAFLGLWGQFAQWDMTGNRERLNEFLSALEAIDESVMGPKNSYKACLDAFPCPVYEIRVPLSEMYAMYTVG